MTRLLAALIFLLGSVLSQHAGAQPAPDHGIAAESAAGPDEGPIAEQRKILIMLYMPAAHFRPNARYGGAYDDKSALAARKRVAADIARENGLELTDGWPMPMIGVDCYVMKVPEGRSIDEVIATVSQNRMVAWSQRLQDFQGLASPTGSDPLYPTQPAASEWRLAQLHQLTTGKGVTIAVIDSKIDVGHPDLIGQFATARDFVTGENSLPENHGTAIAGVIGAKSDNGIGISGIAPSARLMALRACSERRETNISRASCDTLSLAKALQFALERRADIVNMSLSGPSDRLLAALVNAALRDGVSVVAAFDPKRPDGGFPASLPGVIAVADEALPSVPDPVFRAPGRDIPTTQPGGRWYLVNGSSFAAAHVTGLLALIREGRKATPRAVAIARTAGGVVDACASVARVTRECDCTCALGLKLALRSN